MQHKKAQNVQAAQVSVLLCLESFYHSTCVHQVEPKMTWGASPIHYTTYRNILSLNVCYISLGRCLALFFFFFTHAHTHTHARMHALAHIHTCARTHTHTHTHTHKHLTSSFDDTNTTVFRWYHRKLENQELTNTAGTENSTTCKQVNQQKLASQVSRQEQEQEQTPTSVGGLISSDKKYAHCRLG